MVAGPSGKGKSPRATARSRAEKKTAPDQTGTDTGAGVRTVRLPFVTASFSRAPRAARSGGPGAGRPSTPQASVGQAVAGLRSPVPLSRLAFYGGALALGALEVVEWPVTLLVVAGTYIVDRARSSAAGSPVAVSATVESPAFPDVVVPSATEEYSDADHSGHA